jgi:8-oxo-dGTP diphosphatase
MSAPVVVAAAVVERDGAFLLTLRAERTHLAGRWEFPGGKCEPGETLDECLRRELLEELGARVHVGREIFVVTHEYPEKVVELHFFRCELVGDAHPRLGQQMRWVLRDELRGLQFPEADRDLIELLSQPEAERAG